MDISLALAASAAVTSAGILVKEIVELKKTMPNLEAQSICRPCPVVGNDINILNSSSLPVTIVYARLFTATGFWLFRKERRIWSPEDDFLNMSIPAMSGKIISFREGDWWVQKKNNSTYMEVWVVGRKRPIRLLVK